MQSGKSTLLAAVSGKEPPAMGTANITEAVVPVPDDRLHWLTELYKPKKTVKATIDCVDVPGFSFTDDAGRSAARRLIDKIRTVDMFVVVLRAFQDKSVVPYKNRVDPKADLNELFTEMLLADLEMVSTRIERLEKEVHKPTKNQARDKDELALQHKLQNGLEQEIPVSDIIENNKQYELIKSLGLLTTKPIMVVVNISEDQIGQKTDLGPEIEKKFEIVNLCCSIEYELSKLDEKSRKEFMADLGIEKPAVIQFVQSCYKTMGLISFLTVGSDEVRAWPIQKGTTALDAAGKIHSDIKRGFIRAETMSCEDLKELGDEKAVKSAGKARLEGKTYQVQDGDIISFRFNV
jgi:hypothetical protein